MVLQLEMSVNYFIRIHGDDFKYVGLDLFEKNDENYSEVIPSTEFKIHLKTIYHKYIKTRSL